MSSLCDLDTTAVVWSMVVVVCVVWWLSTRRPPGLPPGPGPALPLLGHLHLMKKDPREQFQQWRRQYGDVFSLYLGGRLVVVLNGLPVIKEALVKMADVFSHRPQTYITEKVIGNCGLVLSSGSNWKEQRKTSIEILRRFGMGKNVLAEKIQEEITHYIRAIEDLNGEPADLQKLTTVSICNNISSIVFGQRFEYGDPVLSDYLDRVEENTKHLEGTSAINFFPILIHLPGDMFHAKKVMSNISTIIDTFLWPQIRKHKQAKDPSLEPTDYIDAYIHQMEKKQNLGQSTLLDDQNLLINAGDLFVAGTETTATSIRWVLFYLLHHPEVQDRCFREISDIIGTDRPPNLSDRAKLTYLEATIMEILRISNLAPFAVPHTTPYDVSLRGYVIPKDAMIMPNLTSVLSDPSVWEDPDSFRPERFIGPDNKLVKVDEFIPFGIGRRSCMGKALAQMELFLYLSTLIQRFRFLSPEQEAPPSVTEGYLGFLHFPKPYKIRAVIRD